MKKFLSLLLVTVFLLSVCCVTAYAQNGPAPVPSDDSGACPDLSKDDLNPPEGPVYTYYFWLDSEYHHYGTSSTESFTVSGSATSYLTDDDVTFTLIGFNNNFISSTTGKTEYMFPLVPTGAYKLSVSKKNHVTREYHFTVSNNTTQDVKICPLGDADLNGKVQAADAMKAYQHAQGKADMQLTDYAFLCADVAPVGEPNGKVQAADAMLIYQQAQGKHPLF